jgi:hypothetical protein
MRAVARCLVVVTVAVGVASPSVALANSSAAKPAAARYYPFVGTWHGNGQLSQAGQAPAALALRLSCAKAASGWAVRCAMTAKNKQTSISESDLMGVDPVTGQGHWYAVTNEGDTHDHLTHWVDAHTMQARYAWTQNGTKMEEHITVVFKGRRVMHFRSVVSGAGKEVGAFSADLRR